MPIKLAHGFLSEKHVVVLGAGYVGGAVALRAMQQGARVTALTRNPSQAARLRSMGCQVVVASLASHEWHDHVPEGSCVINTVSSGRRGGEAYRESYLEGARSMIAWAAGTGFSGPWVYTSSTSVYPQGGGVEVDEFCATAGADQRSAILVETEKILQHGLGPGTILRLAGIYGPRRHYLLDRIREAAGPLPGSGHHHLNLIHRDDVVAAILATLAFPPASLGEIFNVIDDGRATRGEIVTWLAQQLGVPSPGFSDRKMPGYRVNRPDRVFSNRRIKERLDWQPHYRTYQEGYLDLLAA